MNKNVVRIGIFALAAVGAVVVVQKVRNSQNAVTAKTND